MLGIFDLAVSLCILALVFLLGSRLPYALGGSISLIVLLPVFYYISYALKRARLEMTLLSITVLLTIGANYLHYLDISGGYTKSTIAVANCTLLLFVLSCFCYAFLEPLNYSRENHQSDQVAILRQNYKSIVLKYLIFPFIYVLATCLVFISAESRYSIKGNFLNIVPISFLWISIALVVLLISLISRENSHFINIFKHVDFTLSDEFDIRKSYLFFMIFIIVIGSAIELLRKSWLLWLESLVVINVAMMSLWTIYKYRWSARRDLVSNMTTDIKPVNTPQSLIKLIFINVIGITLVIFGLIAILVMK